MSSRRKGPGKKGPVKKGPGTIPPPIASTSATHTHEVSLISAIKQRLESLPKPGLYPFQDSDRWNCPMDTVDVRTAISKVATSVVSVALFGGEKPILHCSGLIIGWDKSKSEGTILTTTRLLQFPDECMARETFDLVVRLCDGSLLHAKEENVDFYHNLMTLKVKSDKELNVAGLEDVCIDHELQVISVGRYFFDSSTRASRGELRLAHPKFGCHELLESTCEISDVNEGGPLISTRGSILGINLSYSRGVAYPLPTSVILQCLDRWSSKSPMMEPWVGITLIDSDQMTYNDWEKLNIPPHESRAVVKEVVEESAAYRHGVRPGDTVLSFVDQKVFSAKQFTRILGNISRKWKSRKEIMVVLEKREDKKIVEFDVQMIGASDKRLSLYWPDDIEIWLRSYNQKFMDSDPF